VSEAKPENKRDPNNPCLFCKDARGVSLGNELAYSARDSYAVSPGHTVVIPRRHVASFFDLTPEEINACMALIVEERELLDKEFKPDGYNIGVNIGPAAGQSIFHVHIHPGGRTACDSQECTLHAINSIIPSVLCGRG